MDQQQLRKRLEFYRDLGIEQIYRRKAIDTPLPPQGEPAAQDQLNATQPSGPGSGETSDIRSGNDFEVMRPMITSSVAPPQPSIVLPGIAPQDDTLLKIREDIGECKRCALCQQRSTIVFGSGNETARLVFVGEGPGADEDEQGLPFVGRAGQLLTQMIDNTANREGIPVSRSDMYICNVVKCRPPGNRTPLPEEMEICGQFLYRQLMTIRPKAICALGSTATKALLNSKLGITKLRGEWQKWNGIPVMVTYHPSYLLRQYNQQAKREAWEDLKKVLHFVYD
jgi:DNA polymerase